MYFPESERYYFHKVKSVFVSWYSYLNKSKSNRYWSRIKKILDLMIEQCLSNKSFKFVEIKRKGIVITFTGVYQ